MAAELAALIVERGLGGDGVDLGDRLERFRRERGGRAADMRRLAEGWAAQAGGGSAVASEEPEPSAGALLALAYPDRIARARGRPGAYLLANGRGAELAAHERLAASEWLVAAELAGSAAASRILAAAAIDPAEVEQTAGPGMERFDETGFDRSACALRRRAGARLGAVSYTHLTLPTNREV